MNRSSQGKTDSRGIPKRLAPRKTSAPGSRQHPVGKNLKFYRDPEPSIGTHMHTPGVVRPQPSGIQHIRG